MSVLRFVTKLLFFYKLINDLVPDYLLALKSAKKKGGGCIELRTKCPPHCGSSQVEGMA